VEHARAERVKVGPLLGGLLTVMVTGGLARGGCEREMLEHICEPVDPGQLVFSEIRGKQGGEDTYGQWIEIHNRGATAVDMTGVRVRITQRDGTNEIWLMVREEGLTLDPDDFFVMGRFVQGSEPDHVDYGYASDTEVDLYQSGGILELYVCNEVADSVVFGDLPELGTLAFDGGESLTAESNDDEELWCNDDADVILDPNERGIPGTPGEPNRPCP
jgi:hypothetical protein